MANNPLPRVAWDSVVVIAMKPEDLLSFIHHPIFTRDWKDLGLDDDDLAELELCVMIGPKKAEVIADSGGVRLLKVGPDPRPSRPPFQVVVAYVFFEHRPIAAFLGASRADGDDLEITAEDRERLRELMADIERDI